MRNVPSFVGKIPHEWTESVIQKLQQYSVPKEMIREAFRIARTKKMDFETPYGYSMNELKLIFPVSAEVVAARQVREIPPSLGPVHHNQWTAYGLKQALG